MRKSGLHKQVASIFEGAPVPETTTDAPVSETAAPSRRGFHPDRIAARPQPAPKAAAAAEPSLLKKKHSPVTKKSRSADTDAARRQKKMTLLVGVLSVVFIGVMVISFGGIGQSAATPVVKDDLPAATPVSRFDPESWAFPEPLPEQMRDPLVIPKPETLPEDPLAVTQSTHLAVRGIVHSDTKPSAIVGDQVVTEGQTLYDVKIVKITREEVEFEKDGNRWTQRVE